MALWLNEAIVVQSAMKLLTVFWNRHGEFPRVKRYPLEVHLLWILLLSFGVPIRNPLLDGWGSLLKRLLTSAYALSIATLFLANVQHLYFDPLIQNRLSLSAAAFYIILFLYRLLALLNMIFACVTLNMHRTEIEDAIFIYKTSLPKASTRLCWITFIGGMLMFMTVAVFMEILYNCGNSVKLRDEFGISLSLCIGKAATMSTGVRCGTIAPQIVFSFIAYSLYQQVRNFNKCRIAQSSLSTEDADKIFQDYQRIKKRCARINDTFTIVSALWFIMLFLSLLLLCFIYMARRHNGSLTGMTLSDITLINNVIGCVLLTEFASWSFYENQRTKQLIQNRLLGLVDSVSDAAGGQLVLLCDKMRNEDCYTLLIASSFSLSRSQMVGFLSGSIGYLISFCQIELDLREIRI